MARSLKEYLTAPVDEIIGENVTLAGVALNIRQDDGGKEFTQTTIVLDDGRRYRSSSAVVADILGRIPKDDFPIGPVVFIKYPSTRKGMADYVTVEEGVDDDG